MKCQLIQVFHRYALEFCLIHEATQMSHDQQSLSRLIILVGVIGMPILDCQNPEWTRQVTNLLNNEKKYLKQLTS